MGMFMERALLNTVMYSVNYEHLFLHTQELLCLLVVALHSLLRVGTWLVSNIVLQSGSILNYSS